MEQLFEIAGLSGLRCFDLLIQLFIILGTVNRPKDADRFGKLRVAHPAEQVGQAGLRRFFIVEQQIILR